MVALVVLLVCTITQVEVCADNAYVLSFSKQGTYQFDCTCYEGVSGVDTDNVFGSHPGAIVIGTKDVHLSGTADVDLQLIYELKQ